MLVVVAVFVVRKACIDEQAALIKRILDSAPVNRDCVLPPALLDMPIEIVPNGLNGGWERSEGDIVTHGMTPLPLSQSHAPTVLAPITHKNLVRTDLPTAR